MGKLHNELRHGTLSVAVSRALGDMEGGGVERYGETLTPILNPWERPEWAFLANERLCAIARFQAAVPAEFPALALFVPATARVLAVVDALTFQYNGTVRIQAATEAALLATLAGATSANLRDRRTPQVSVTVAQTLAGSDPAAAIGPDLEQVVGGAANVAADVCVPFVLTPGVGIVVIGQTVNTNMTVNFRFRERNAYSSELVP